MRFKKFFFIILFFFISESSQAFFENNCVVQNKHFISNYFAGLSSLQQVDDFFDCIDNVIQLILNHTETENPNFYNQIEIYRLARYLGAQPKNAQEISQAFLDIKKSLIGGGSGRISLYEIEKIRKILREIQKRLKAMHTYTGWLVNVLNKKNVHRNRLNNSLQELEDNLLHLGHRLKVLSVTTHLALLKNLPNKLRQLGLLEGKMPYWQPLISLISQWKKIFSGPPESSIQPGQWPALLNSFSQVIRMWFYYTYFLEDKVWLDVQNVQHTQHFLYLSLNLIKTAEIYSQNKGIYLTDIEELARRLWFVPAFSKPSFSLGLYSVRCFLLERLSQGKPCRYELDYGSTDYTVSLKFAERSYVFNRDKQSLKIQFTGPQTERLNSSHIAVLFDYLRSWTGTEMRLRREGRLRPIFGSPHKWLNRNIDADSADKKLIFQKKLNSSDLTLMSYLNWHTHIAHFLMRIYASDNRWIQQENWMTLVEEWTPLALSFRPDFQTEALSFFSQGDLLTSQANGDNWLQPKETLELITIASSSLSRTSLFSNRLKKCKITIKKEEALLSECVWKQIQRYTKQFFDGFNGLLSWFSKNQQNKLRYMQLIKSFFTDEVIPLGEVLKLYVIIHHQENIMEFLDKDKSQNLNLKEILPFYYVIKNHLAIPLMYTNESKLAAFTYILHFESMPVYNDNKLSSPVHFSNWLLDLKQQKKLLVDRSKLFLVLKLMQNYM